MIRPEDLVAIALRFFVFAFLIYVIDRWSWGHERPPSIWRALWYSLSRIFLGGVAGWFVNAQIESTGQGLADPQTIFFVLTRFFLWVGFFYLLGARGVRMLVGILCAMALHVILDMILAKTVLFELPFYC